MAAEREYLSQLAEFDLLDDTVVSYESIIDETMEIVGYEPNMIRIRHCRHADETYGQFGLQLL